MSRITSMYIPAETPRIATGIVLYNVFREVRLVVLKLCGSVGTAAAGGLLHWTRQDRVADPVLGNACPHSRAYEWRGRRTGRSADDEAELSNYPISLEKRLSEQLKI